MNTEPEDHAERLAARAKTVFDDSLEHLDGRTRSRLNQARHAALEAARGPRHPAIRWWLPTGSLAALALVAVIGVRMLQGGGVTSGNGGVEDLELLTSSDSLELIEDVDFYAWLDSSAETALPAEPLAGESG